MPNLSPGNSRKEVIARLATDTDISDVAEGLGLRVIGGGTKSPKVLCPFHDDHRPSMQLYPASGMGRSQFHCFACSAHGDVFDLVKRQLNVDFQSALEWLAHRYHIEIPRFSKSSRDARLSNKTRGLELGLKTYAKQSPKEAAELKSWAKGRKLKLSVLNEAEVFAAFPPKIATGHNIADREQIDDLEVAGLILRETRTRPGQSIRLPFETPPRDFYSTKRIIFTIRNDRGSIAGFAGRAIGEDQPKYLFSPGFPRGDTLYRLHELRALRPRRKPKGHASVVDLFVVEGLMDALRLDSLGLKAVALLGSQITANQVKLLTDYSNDLDRDGHQLAIHLFLDSDEAGSRGAVNTIVKLLEANIDTPGMLLDCIVPILGVADTKESKHDPDELLRDVNDSQAAFQQVSAWCQSPMALLLSAAVETPLSKLDATWESLPESIRLQAFRDVERRLDRSRWNEIFARTRPFSSYLGDRSARTSEWQDPLETFLCATRRRVIESNLPTNISSMDDNSRLIRAIQIAEASTQRREFPIDEGSWDRIQAAIDVTLPHFRFLLENATSVSILDADPMLAVLVPKSEGKFRLKALPSPEILSLQQYVLNELLRSHSNCPRFRQLIPAVRFAANSGAARLETTGIAHLIPVNGESVSFAYTLDMDVIEHRTPPQRTGMFRSYFECWRDFIGFIDARIAAFPRGKFHVARLDVRSFYDTVTRPAVNAVLFPAVTDALAELADAGDTNDSLGCARLFCPEIRNSRERARAIVDWLCDQSFNYSLDDRGLLGSNALPSGLPQGPDLSAYLANISLFPLDRALSELVAQLDRNASEEQGEVLQENQISSFRGAVYARYVDDMVIIARTGRDLAQLREAIEQQLSLIGMELSPKTDLLPVMDEAAVREWLTDRRGAGLGVSGPFEGPPANSPLAILEPLAAGRETDRSDSLRVLHDPRLDDPATTVAELESAVEIVLAAPDLRHGDKVSAARHLWRTVLQVASTQPAVSDVVSSFVESWKSASSGAKEGRNSPYHSEISELLAWLDGIERFLTSRPDRNPTFSEQKHHILRDYRELLASLVHQGLCEKLISEIPNTADSSRFKHMIDLKLLVIHRAATLIKRPVSSASLTFDAGTSRAKARLIISLAEAQQSTQLLDRTLLRATITSLGIHFHEAVARLRIFNRAEDERPDRGMIRKDIVAPSAIDPLMTMKQSITVRQQKGQLDSPLERILELWLPDASSTSHDLVSAEVALRAFINLVPQQAVDLIDRRPALKRFALDGSGGSKLRLLPTPPGLDIPGLLGLLDNDRVVVRADFHADKPSHFCPNLNWIEKNPEGQQGWKRFSSNLDDKVYLSPPDGEVLPPHITSLIARAFRSLVGFAEQTSDRETCPPTATNLIGSAIMAGTPESVWEVLGFCVPVEKVRGQAFLRQNGGLVLEPIMDLHDHVWRAGTALADWLGRAPSTRQQSTQRLAAPALVENEGEDWAQEAMLRFSLCRLRGKSLPPTRSLRVSSESGLPLMVERVLKRLENFPTDSTDSTSYIGMSHLLATLAEGRAIRVRIESRIDPTLSGGATALLGEMVRGQFRSDEELANRLPQSVSELPPWAPVRRPARALFALAERLQALAELDPMRGSDLTLNALAGGTRILCLESQLRSQALELWALADLASQNKFQESPPSLAEWSLDSTALLHREQPTLLQGAQIPTDWRNVRELFQKLCQGTIEGQRVDWGAIAGITPLGWIVVLGSLTGALQGNWRGGFVDSEALTSDQRTSFRDLALKLSHSGTDTDDLPWCGLELVISSWNSDEFQHDLETLEAIDSAAGLRVQTWESSRFYLEASRKRPTEIQTSDGLRQLPSWAVSWAKAFDENRGGIERVAATKPLGPVIFRWTETWRGDRIVGVGVVQPAMVALAGNAFSTGMVVGKSKDSETSATVKSSSLPIEIPKVIATEPSSTVANSEGSRVSETSPGNSPSPRLTKRSSDVKSIQAALSELETLQERSWRTRGEKPQSHARVALFQWDVDETYRHPGFDLCDFADPQFDRMKPEKWNQHSHGISCSEYRRRELLKSVLKACRLFNVDILLLPEYSMRPDTVKWLREQLPVFASQTSIWAGTYRLPPKMISMNGLLPWNAVHEIVLAEIPRQYRSRVKKYPAAAADEVFHPGNAPITPLFAEQAIQDVRSYVFELICSEVFLVTSPANLLPLARVRRQLLRKFNANNLPDLNATIEEDVIGDIKGFARHTALSESLSIRRTLFLVPSMTSRAADYWVLGQAGFLASGLTTVFCNADCAPYGNGQSCFIGHNGWIDGKEAPGMPSFEPYHGVCPGIFQLDHWHRGHLGKNEQALVIADIDPIYGPEGKPRPQTLLKPLQLVAHLPVIENWKPHTNSLRGACRCRRSENPLIEMGEFAPQLLQAIKNGVDANWVTTMDDPSPNELTTALQVLAECAGQPGGGDESNSGWLRQRSKAYLANHLADPTPWPPPVALDWLWVGLSSQDRSLFPEIEAPPYAMPPGGESRQVPRNE